MTQSESALDRQVGGDHYKDFIIEPLEFMQKNSLNPCEANIVKYICRWRTKGGLQDLRKAQHYLEYLIELEYPNATSTEAGRRNATDAVLGGEETPDAETQGVGGGPQGGEGPDAGASEQTTGTEVRGISYHDQSSFSVVHEGARGGFRVFSEEAAGPD